MRSDRLLTLTAVADVVVALGVAIGLRDFDALGLTVVLGLALLVFRLQRLVGGGTPAPAVRQHRLLDGHGRRQQPQP